MFSSAPASRNVLLLRAGRPPHEENTRVLVLQRIAARPWTFQPKRRIWGKVANGQTRTGPIPRIIRRRMRSGGLETMTNCWKEGGGTKKRMLQTSCHALSCHCASNQTGSSPLNKRKNVSIARSTFSSANRKVHVFSLKRDLTHQVIQPAHCRSYKEQFQSSAVLHSVKGARKTNWRKIISKRIDRGERRTTHVSRFDCATFPLWTKCPSYLDVSDSFTRNCPKSRQVMLVQLFSHSLMKVFWASHVNLSELVKSITDFGQRSAKDP